MYNVLCRMFSLVNVCLRKIDQTKIPLNIDLKDCYNEIAPIVAAMYGHLKCLKYANENKSYFDSDLCQIAAIYGYIECLKYAHEKCGELNKYKCYSAAINNNLECLKYAHKNSCSWDRSVCEKTAEKGSLEC